MMFEDVAVDNHRYDIDVTITQIYNRVTQLSLSNTTSSNTTSLNSRIIGMIIAYPHTCMIAYLHTCMSQVAISMGATRATTMCERMNHTSLLHGRDLKHTNRKNARAAADAHARRYIPLQLDSTLETQTG